MSNLSISYRASLGSRTSERSHKLVFSCWKDDTVQSTSLDSSRLSYKHTVLIHHRKTRARIKYDFQAYPSTTLRERPALNLRIWNGRYLYLLLSIHRPYVGPHRGKNRTTSNRPNKRHGSSPELGIIRIVVDELMSRNPYFEPG